MLKRALQVPKYAYAKACSVTINKKNYLKCTTKLKNIFHSIQSKHYYNSINMWISLFQENTTHFGHSKAGSMSMKKKKKKKNPNSRNFTQLNCFLGIQQKSTKSLFYKALFVFEFSISCLTNNWPCFTCRGEFFHIVHLAIEHFKTR